MLATLSYYDQNKRKQFQIPYYELQNVMQEIYDRDKDKVDFDFQALEQKYTYFKPYFDYILLQKQGKLDGFILENRKVYSIGNNMYYTEGMDKNNHIPYLKSDDKSIMLNERNINYDALLLSDAISISYEKANKHSQLIIFYLQYIISQNKEIAVHYKRWMEINKNLNDPHKTYVTCFLSGLSYVDFGDYIWYLKAEGIETRKQREWIDKHDAKPLHTYRLNREEKELARQFIKSFS